MNHAEIRALSLVAVRDAIQAGELTSEAVTAAAIEQAERFDRDFALFITFTPDLALEKAREADKTRAAGKRLPPLHGVPITVKDNIDTAGLRTTGGAHVFANRVPSEDATVVQKLQAAGAISLGKTNPVGGTTDGLPVGLQLVSGAFLDLKLLAIAALVEKSMQFDTTPPILKTLEAVA